MNLTVEPTVMSGTEVTFSRGDIVLYIGGNPAKPTPGIVTSVDSGGVFVHWYESWRDQLGYIAFWASFGSVVRIGRVEDDSEYRREI